VDSRNLGSNGFDVVYFGIGTNSLTPGTMVPADTTFTFDIELTNNAVYCFLQESLSEGNLKFVVPSLHPASFMGPATYPQWYTKDNFVGVPPTLSAEIVVNPCLSIRATTEVLTLQWSAGVPGYVAQSATDLFLQDWVDIGIPPVQSNGFNVISISQTSLLDRAYFRLHQP
ncbi:MAG: hypothetical protein AAF492_28015, partial [Verrucomicrobiota bacterium]